jgi:hypothetical protein
MLAMINSRVIMMVRMNETMATRNSYVHPSYCVTWSTFEKATHPCTAIRQHVTYIVVVNQPLNIKESLL